MGTYCAGGVKRDCGGTAWWCAFEGMHRPIPASSGYRTLPNGTNETTRVDQELCPVAHFCNGTGVAHACPSNTFATTPGHAECKSLSCSAGYYCDPSNPTAEVPCGAADVYCPANTFETSGFAATPGLYTTGGTEATRSSQTKCEGGFYCADGVG